MLKERTLIRETAVQMVLAGMSLDEGREELWKEMISECLKQNKGNLCHAARDLREHRNTLSRQVQDLGIADVAKQIRGELRRQSSLPLRKPRRAWDKNWNPMDDEKVA